MNFKVSQDVIVEGEQLDATLQYIIAPVKDGNTIKVIATAIKDAPLFDKMLKTRSIFQKLILAMQIASDLGVNVE